MFFKKIIGILFFLMVFGSYAETTYVSLDDGSTKYYDRFHPAYLNYYTGPFDVTVMGKPSLSFKLHVHIHRGSQYTIELSSRHYYNSSPFKLLLSSGDIIILKKGVRGLLKISRRDKKKLSLYPVTYMNYMGYDYPVSKDIQDKIIYFMRYSW
jgi:hypothetical protein